MVLIDKWSLYGGYFNLINEDLSKYDLNLQGRLYQEVVSNTGLTVIGNVYHLNPYHAEYLKWNNPSYIFGTVHYHFQGYQDENLKLVSQQYRAWSDCTARKCSLAWLYTGGKGLSLSVLAG